LDRKGREKARGAERPSGEGEDRGETTDHREREVPSPQTSSDIRLREGGKRPDSLVYYKLGLKKRGGE